jgi:hypothetical protein
MMGRSSLGTDMVTGKNRVPRPAAGITALRICMKNEYWDLGYERGES